MKAILFFVAALLAQAGTGTSGAVKSQEQIVELARQATVRYCEDRKTDGPIYMNGKVIGPYCRTHCEFLAKRTADGWQVSGHPVYEDSKGAQEIAEGGDVVLYYSPTGELLRHEGQAF